MHLHKHRRAAVDEAARIIGFPEGTTAVERGREERADGVEQIRHAPRRRHRDRPDMVVEIELVVLHPFGQRQVERRVDDTLPHPRIAGGHPREIVAQAARAPAHRRE